MAGEVGFGVRGQRKIQLVIMLRVLEQTCNTPCRGLPCHEPCHLVGESAVLLFSCFLGFDLGDHLATSTGTLAVKRVSTSRLDNHCDKGVGVRVAGRQSARRATCLEYAL